MPSVLANGKVSLRRTEQKGQRRWVESLVMESDNGTKPGAVSRGDVKEKPSCPSTECVIDTKSGDRPNVGAPIKRWKTCTPRRP